MKAQAPESAAVLRRFTQPRQVVERCELCSAALAPQHQHLVEPSSRRLMCACEACAMLFSGTGETKYRRVPRDGRVLSEFELSDSQWHALRVPIGLAFFFYNSRAEQVVAIYPSPAGPTETVLEQEAWDEIVDGNPVLRDLVPDVEALLVNRIADKREYYVAPIDQCYQLGGLIRVKWQGLSGGAALWEEIDRFFATFKRLSY